MSGLRQMGKEAVRLAAAGRHAAAVAVWEQMHERAPDNPSVSLGLGAALLAAGRVPDAQAWLMRSCHRHPASAALVALLGRALLRKGQYELAIGAYYEALSLEPDHGEAQSGLASALLFARQPQAALPHAARGFDLALSELSLSTFLAVLVELGQFDRALAVLAGVDPSGPLDPGTLMLYRATIDQAADRFDDALEAFRESVRLSPDNTVAQHNFAAALLLRGIVTAEAWANYEGRSGLLAGGAWPAERFRWTDQDVTGRTVVVHAEQGMGDTLQFVRYVPLVAARGARVVLVVQPALVTLLQGTPGAAEVIGAGMLPPFDYYVPLLSLPGKFGTTLDTIPPPLAYQRGGRPQTASTSRALQVGMVWAGRPSFLEDRKRSLLPEDLAPLAGMDGVEFVSLQFEAGAMPFPGMRDGMQGVTDFAETADRVAALDLVISVDTAVAHLAATMGKPVWLLARHNGCWRWMQDREDSPWYPSVRLFRQGQAGEWAPVLARVRAELAALAAAPAITLAA